MPSPLARSVAKKTGSGCVHAGRAAAVGRGEVIEREEYADVDRHSLRGGRVVDCVGRREGHSV